jgi:YVTN family beta-propeller protein
MIDQICLVRRSGILSALLAGAVTLWAIDDKPLAQTAEPVPLQLEAKIPLGDVRGRIDHMAIDIERQRLFVAELGNNSVGVVDLESRKLIRTIAGLKEPQGVAYVAFNDTLYVANAGDGSVRLFAGPDYKTKGQIDLGDDADNIRVDTATNRIIAGYGSGGLAVIEAANNNKIGDIPLSAHPESFQLDPDKNRIYVNLPEAKAVAVVDSRSAKQVKIWPMEAGGNFAMALDRDADYVLIAFRSPAKLGVFSERDGALIANPETSGDADDLFVDAKRHRAYVSCGDGFVDVFDTQGASYKRIAHIPTVPGARTSLFVPELDQLLLAVRAGSREPAAIWVFHPTP